MKHFLIIPLGGLGKRFLYDGYKTYKPFLKISKNTRIIDNIVNNFPKKNTHIIIIGNEKKFKNITNNFKRKNTSFIKIKNHNSGPLYSIFLAKEKIKKIVKDKSFFISYSDINWKWNFSNVIKNIFNKKIVVFSHQSFHPHLDVDPRADFFITNKSGELKKVSEKKTINKDYKKDKLAIGCYFFNNFNFFENFFRLKNFKKIAKKKEIYIINLLNYCLKNKTKINHFRINKFVHLGVPSQYEDFINWQNVITTNLKQNLNLNYPNFMLMAGKGKRLKSLNTKKPFLKFIKQEIYQYIFKKFSSKRNYIITNKNYSKSINKRFKTCNIQKTKSMLQTVEKSIDIFKKDNFFILSCDCFGDFDSKKFKKFIKLKKPDVVLFTFKISKLQRLLSNSHTTIKIFKNKIKSISVKKFTNQKNEFGHAGFFWVKNKSVFNNLDNFNSNIKIKREILLDDYFKFLFDKKLCKVKHFELNTYTHVGSIKEYFELKYWEDYFL
jgi:NDP-sugar pyrophosphorylase family protein